MSSPSGLDFGPPGTPAWSDALRFTEINLRKAVKTLVPNRFCAFPPGHLPEKLFAEKRYAQLPSFLPIPKLRKLNG